jgi:hypothetical protein
MRANPLIAVYTFSFGIIALVFLYITGFIINTYLYVPHWIKEHMQDIPILGHMLHKHHYHHTHFHDDHQEELHGNKVKHVEEFILKSLDSGHELFYIVENLVEHNWPVDVIEEAMEKAEHDRLFDQDKKHVMHYHHNKEKITALSEWIKKFYQDHSIKNVVDIALEKGWTEDDVILAFRRLKGKIKVHSEDKEIMQYMYVVN